MDEDSLKLTTYLAERRRTDDGFVSDALLDLCTRHRIACAVVLRGIGGFGTGRHLRTDESLTLSEDPPVAIVAVDTRAKIEALLDPVLAIKRRGLVTWSGRGCCANTSGRWSCPTNCAKPSS